MKFYKNSEYEIDEYGNVYRNDKKIKPYKCKNGYLKIVGSLHGNRFHIWIHKAVAELYVTDTSGGSEVLHLDGDRLNNHYSNLIWTTRQHISNHTTKVLMKNIGEFKGEAKLKNEDIIYIRENYIPRHKEYGCRAMAKMFNVSASAVSQVLIGKTWQHI